MNTTDFTPIPVIEVDAADLADPGWSADRLTPNQQGQVCLRVRHHGWPLAQQVETGLASGDDAVARVRAIVIEHQGVVPDGWPHRYPTAQQLVSVVVCTLGREPRLRATITSLLEQSHARLEVIVVDNDPATGRTANLLGHLTDRRLRIVPEPRRGLSVARNTGLAAARGSLIAYTDDDAVADSGWIAALVSVFAADDGRLGCVTGLVLPAEFATAQQLFFEECSGFSKGFVAMHWSRGEPAPKVAALTVPGHRGITFPFSGGEFGSGNNMAFRADTLRRLGGFDVALGAGSPTRGGEDLDIFRRVHLAGHGIVYHPAAIVTHHHRREHEALRDQMFGYGSGMAAVITKQVCSGNLLPILRRLPAALRLLLSPHSEKNADKSAQFPADVSRAELKGYLAGPWLYLRAVLRARSLRR